MAARTDVRARGVKASILRLFHLNTPTYFSPEEEKDLIYYLDNKSEHYFIIEMNNEIIGSGGINFSEDRTIGILSWDIVHPNFQRSGFGRLLVEHRIEKLKSTGGIEQILVRTSQLVYKFYEKSGFKLIEHVKDYWAKGFDLYKMEYTNF